MMKMMMKKGPVMQILVPKGRAVTTNLYKNVVIRKLKKYYKTRYAKTGHKQLRLLHDNALAHKVHLMTKFLESEKVTIIPYSPFLPDLALQLFSVQNQISCIWKI